jgi:GTP-binding protein
LNRILHDAFERRPPQSHKGKHGKLFYEHQVNIAPPTFQFFVNDPDLFHNNYKRYLEKQIRNVLGFDGAPLIIHYKKRPKSKGGRSKEEEILEDDNITDNSNRESSFDNDSSI